MNTRAPSRSKGCGAELVGSLVDRASVLPSRRPSARSDDLVGVWIVRSGRIELTVAGAPAARGGDPP